VGSICESDVFKKLLEVVLTFGNFLNQGSFRGNAQGVKINFLGELSAHEKIIKETSFSLLWLSRACLGKRSSFLTIDN
jgi:hypothetical protein